MYHGFISYGHAADGHFAPRPQTTLVDDTLGGLTLSGKALEPRRSLDRRVVLVEQCFAQDWPIDFRPLWEPLP